MLLTVIGQAPKNPEKNRQINTVCKSLPVAHAISNTENPKLAITSGSLLPFNSENGVHRIGPVANPNTYNDVPSVATTDPTANFSEICLVAVLNIELANAAVMVVKPNMAAVKIFFLTAQFWACKGSSGPSNSTT
jgi:hypothetical protein